MMKHARTYFFTLAVLVALTTTASAQVRATTVRIEGTTVESTGDARPRARWHLRVNRKEVLLFVAKLTVLSGATTDAEILRHLKANRAAIVVTGPAAALETLGGPKPKSVTISGTLRWADTPPLLLVSNVE